MVSSPSQAASQAVRKLLRDLGRQYDIHRGLRPFSDNKSIFSLILFFDYKCCYCHVSLRDKQWDKDHLEPINKDHAGLHAWGNIAPSCKKCNNQRLNQDWAQFLRTKTKDEEDFITRKAKIEKYINKYNYSLNPMQKERIKMLANDLQTSVFSFVSRQIDMKLKEGSGLF